MKSTLAYLRLVSALLLILVPVAMASTIWYVDGVNGNDENDCKSPQTACKTIGHAISLASSGDTIGVGPATYTEKLAINISVTIVGAYAKRTIIDGGGVGPVVTVSGNIHVALSGLTIQNGSAYGGGGGISSYGALTISKCSISGNTATPNIRGSAQGAGIYIGAGTLVVNDSTISGNTARGGKICEKECTGSAQGAGIYLDAYTKQTSLTLNNSTVSGNNAISGRLPSSGGAIAGGGSASINSSTLANNSASSGGGVFWAAAATLQNSIVANNSGGNCGATLTSDGYNLSSDSTCNFTGPGDMNNIEPLLGPLQNNGGPTETLAELAGSPTIDAGNPNGCTDSKGQLLKIDQRGFPRPGKDKRDHRCDMGAYESQTD